MVDIVITLSEDSKPDSAAKELAESGLAVTQVLTELRLVFGRTDPKRMKKIASLRFVKSVEVSRKMGIAPPDSAVQ